MIKARHRAVVFYFMIIRVDDSLQILCYLEGSKLLLVFEKGIIVAIDKNSVCGVENLSAEIKNVAHGVGDLSAKLARREVTGAEVCGVENLSAEIKNVAHDVGDLSAKLAERESAGDKVCGVENLSAEIKNVARNVGNLSAKLAESERSK